MNALVLTSFGDELCKMAGIQRVTRFIGKKLRTEWGGKLMSNKAEAAAERAVAKMERRAAKYRGGKIEHTRGWRAAAEHPDVQLARFMTE